MKKRLKKILLIDDSESDNFIHKRRLQKADVAEEIVIATNGQEALDYLNTVLEDDNFPAPDLIFLDINMPVMDGWEFLDQYHKLHVDKQARIILAMLTTSTADRDRERAAGFDSLTTFITKPLRQSDIDYITNNYFPEPLAEEE